MTSNLLTFLSRFVFSVMYMMICANAGYADNQRSIESTAIDWADHSTREKLLSQAPEWRESDIKLMQSVYHPANTQSVFQYNLSFINRYWGPINNPFVVMPRPAKAYLFTEDYVATIKSSSFILAPVFKRQLDQRYYVFDFDSATIISLVDWERKFENKYHQSPQVKFNVCAGYGSFPADNCQSKSYQDEVTAAESDEMTHSLLNTSNRDVSAKRQPQVDWRIAANAQSPKHLQGVSIYDSSVSWSDLTKRSALLQTVTPWTDNTIINSYFEKIRDIRYYDDPSVTDFLRRISWLYPDDGCWTRASAVVGGLFGPENNPNHVAPRPSKVFAFGNLCANTPNASSGNVYWWYHTAPIVRDEKSNKTYVLDQSIDAYKPVTVEEWMSLIASQTGSCGNSGAYVERFAICNGYGSTPYDSCHTSLQNEIMPLVSQPYWQESERQRQIELGRDPQSVLGESPPWK